MLGKIQTLERSAMPRQRLHKILEELRDELDATEALTENDRNKLIGVVDQIRETVGDKGEVDSDDLSLLDALDDAALHFEAEHPRLTKTLYQISEVLRSAGLT
jgi:hypothetical protein